MGRKTESGFTIVETMLFLGVSALLFAGILVATGSTVSDARFTDTLKGTESFMQRQYDEVVNGVNPRTNADSCGAPSDPGTSNCLLLGRLIKFNANSSMVNVYDVVGSTSAVAGVNPTSLQALNALPAIATSLNQVEQFELPWDARFTSARRHMPGSPPTDFAIDTVAYLRSPISSQITTFVFNSNDPMTGNLSLKTPTNFINAAYTTYSRAAICLTGSDGATSQYRGTVTLAAGQGAAAVSSARVDAATWTGECT